MRSWLRNCRSWRHFLENATFHAFSVIVYVRNLYRYNRHEFFYRIDHQIGYFYIHFFGFIPGQDPFLAVKCEAIDVYYICLLLVYPSRIEITFLRLSSCAVRIFAYFPLLFNGHFPWRKSEKRLANIRKYQIFVNRGHLSQWLFEFPAQ